MALLMGVISNLVERQDESPYALFSSHYHEVGRSKGCKFSYKNQLKVCKLLQKSSRILFDIDYDIFKNNLLIVAHILKFIIFKKISPFFFLSFFLYCHKSTWTSTTNSYFLIPKSLQPFIFQTMSSVGSISTVYTVSFQRYMV